MIDSLAGDSCSAVDLTQVDSMADIENHDAENSKLPNSLEAMERGN